MSQFNISKLQKKLRKRLKNDRYVHTLGVAYTASSLAMRYGYDIKKALIAGLLHDCAKGMKVSEYISFAQKHNIDINEFEYKNPQLLHAKIGGFLAKVKYKVADEEIINAINIHTTGKPDMNMLEKIIYVADYIEPSRDKAKRLSEIREAAFKDIDLSIFYISEDTVKYLTKKDMIIDPMTIDTFEFYKGVINGRD